MKTNLFLALLFVLCLRTCSGEVIGGGETPEDPNTPTEQTEIREPKQLVFSSAEEQLQYRTNEFSMNMLTLIGQNETKKENICFSPLSASMALGILMNGADGNTLSQMQKTLGFEGVEQDDINAYYKNLLLTLPYLDTTTIVNIANALWLKEIFPFNQDYKQITEQVFDATIDNVDDFTKQATLDMINQWGSDKTNGLINEILTRDMVSPSTVMIFANALYFKGIWESVFDKKLTQAGEFTTLSGQKVKTEMMRMNDDLLYTMSNDAQLVELNYKDGKYCMDILLPAEGTDLSDFLETLTLNKWESYIKSLYSTQVHIELPKFKFNYNRELTDDLKKAGIIDVFNPNANLSRLSNMDTYLSFVKQYCYIAVDEESTEAAAVTVGGVRTTSVGGNAAFIANHPFIFVIREKQYGTILFTGIVGDPTKEE